MPPRKSNVSTTSNGVEDGAETTPARAAKEGLNVEDLSLPKSMIGRLAKGVLPANTQVHKDALLALHKCTTVFVNYIAATSSENAQLNGKKTIMPQDVMAALKDAEFEDFLPRLEAELKKYNETQCDKRNTYRRKIKEEKAAAAAVEPEEGEREGQAVEGANGTNGMNEASEMTNSMVGEDEGENERPTKKFKARNGSAVLPDVNDQEDDDVDDEQDDDHDADDAEDERDEEDADEDGDEGEDESDGDGEGGADDVTEDADPDDMAAPTHMRDEALDDPDNESD